MRIANFSNNQFIDESGLDNAESLTLTSLMDITSSLHTPGLIGASNLSFSYSGLNITVNAPLPFRALFSDGTLASANGTADGESNSSATVDFLALVPATGSVTAYLVATSGSIMQEAYQVIGPPVAHPDYNPNFGPYTAYAEEEDTILFSATTTVPNNTDTLFIASTVLSAGQTTITSSSTDGQLNAGSILSQNVAILENFTAGGTIVASGTATAAAATSPANLIPYGQAFQFLQPTASESITLGNVLHTVVQPSSAITADIAITLEPGGVAGQDITGYGSASASGSVTYQSNVTTGSPYIELPDGSQVYSWTIPASSPSQGIHADWDGTNWRARVIPHRINVVEFGADPTGVNDSTAAIQAALNKAAQLAVYNDYSGVGNVSFYTAPEVVFPNGTYLVSSQLTVNKYVQLKTDGVASIVTSMASGYLIQFAGAGGSFTQHQSYKLIDGDLHLINTNSANTATAILLGGTTSTNGDCYEAEINSVFVAGFNTSHMYGFNAWGINWINCTFTAGVNNSNGACIQSISGATNAGERFTYIGCVFGNNAYPVFYNFNGSMEFKFIGCSIDYNGSLNYANFFYTSNNAVNTIVNCIGCHFEWNVSELLVACSNSTVNQNCYISITDSWILYEGSTAAVGLFFIGAPEFNLRVKGNVYGSGNAAINYAYEWGADATSGSWDLDDPTVAFILNPGTITNYFSNTNPGGTLVTQRIVPPATQSNQAVQLGQFPVSLAANGYQKLASGLIIQWGNYTPVAANTIYDVALPITFPTAALVLTVTPYNGDTTVYAGQGYFVNTSTIGVVGNLANGALNFIAIGY